MSETETRDYLAEMHAVLTAAISDTETPNPVVAQDIVDKLRANDPDLLNGWLHLRAAAIVCEHLGRIDHSERRHTRAVAAGRAFAEAAARHEAGEADAMAGFEARYVINDDGARRRVADMTGPDHLFVAGKYGESARTQRFLESVHRAVAKKVGNRRTAEVFTAEQYAAMFDRAPKPAGKAAAA